jgi:polygalacturonase
MTMRDLKKAIGIYLLMLCSASAIAEEFNVLKFGAVADGRNLDTKHIQNAINEASVHGGVVIFPAGAYLSGTIYLKSNVTLRLQKGATLLGSTDLLQYPENLPDYNFFRKGIIKRALIYAENLENVAIEGEGTIDGQGYAFKEPEDKNVSSYSVRPYVIWMIRCRNVRVEGIRLQNSALWMQHYLGCEKVYIRGIEVYNHSNKNNDMMDIDGCRDVIIADCRGDTDDDGITLKSTHAQPNENITITNCIISSHCNAIKCGTESNAGFKNIAISNCIIRPSEDREVIYGKPNGISGISLEVVDGAEMNGINISNIIMDGPAVPLFIRLGNRARGYDQTLPEPGSWQY